MPNTMKKQQGRRTDNRSQASRRASKTLKDRRAPSRPKRQHDTITSLGWIRADDYDWFCKMRDEAVRSALETKSTLPTLVPATLTITDPVRASPTGAEQIPVLRVREPRDPVFPSRFDRTTTLPRCGSAQESHNNNAIAQIQTKAALVDQVRTAADSLNGQSSSADKVNKAAEAHDNAPSPDGFYPCSPSGDHFVSVWNNFVDRFNAAMAALGRATDRLIANAERDHGTMKAEIAAVVQKRIEFETLGTGGEGVQGIRNAHVEFVKATRVVESYVFGNWAANNNHDRVRTFGAAVQQTLKEEAAHSAITELDRLRDEYAERERPVPGPAEFTKTAHSRHFSFAQLNTGDYSWALLRPILLSKLDELHDLMTAAQLPVQLNSVYRNPARQDSVGSSPLSRHQYGDAVDFQVFDNNHDGKRKDDWKVLEKVVVRSRPSYVEPIKISGEGHVHADWR